MGEGTYRFPRFKYPDDQKILGNYTNTIRSVDQAYTRAAGLSAGKPPMWFDFILLSE
jgi:hypothetical protein